MTGPVTDLVGVSTGSSDATCPAGTGIVSGGYASDLAYGDAFINEPDGNNGWRVFGVNDNASYTDTIQAVAVCAS